MTDKNQRKFFRVKTLFPATWRMLNHEEINLIQKGEGHRLLKTTDLPNPIDELIERSSPGSNEEQLYKGLQYINRKLDFIIDQFVSVSTDSLPEKNDVIEISASGLKFTSQKPLQINDYLKMDVIMPGTFHYLIEFLAQVVRIEEKGSGFSIAAKIVEIDESARDEIIQVIFQKQRKDIREQRIPQGE
jgi:hypothetical protein